MTSLNILDAVDHAINDAKGNPAALLDRLSDLGEQFGQRQVFCALALTAQIERGRYESARVLLNGGRGE